MSELETRLKQQARALGFELVGIAPATPADGFDRLRDWLERGFAGSMDYMHRHAAARRSRPPGRCPPPDQPLRHLHRLPRLLPDGGLRWSRPARRAPLYQLSHHRAEGVSTCRAAAGPGRMGVRLRRVPGSLPLEPQGSPRERAQLAGPARPGMPRSDRAAGTVGGGVPAPVPRY